jgi:hypothetical protein
MLSAMSLHAMDQQLKRKGRTVILARAMGPACASHQLGRHGTTVQAETVPVFFGSEALGENACQMFRIAETVAYRMQGTLPDFLRARPYMVLQ